MGSAPKAGDLAQSTEGPIVQVPIALAVHLYTPFDQGSRSFATIAPKKTSHDHDRNMVIDHCRRHRLLPILSLGLAEGLICSDGPLLRRRSNDLPTLDDPLTLNGCRLAAPPEAQVDGRSQNFLG